MFEGINLGRDDEIICPTYTFFATISSVVYTGAHPVFCDCDESGNITVAEIQKKITTKTKAVIVTHMWGMPCDMDKIVILCKKNNLYLLEDCSHAHGAEYMGSKVGTFGDAAAWSL
jgi:dTDP-4-amino-4,6-dideoxygalactose transaminase